MFRLFLVPPQASPMELVAAEIKEALAGQRAPRELEIPWYNRAPDDETFVSRCKRIEEKGLSAMVSLFVSGNSQTPDTPLLGLRVVPLESAPTSSPLSREDTEFVDVLTVGTGDKTPDLDWEKDAARREGSWRLLGSDRGQEAARKPLLRKAPSQDRNNPLSFPLARHGPSRPGPPALGAPEVPL